MIAACTTAETSTGVQSPRSHSDSATTMGFGSLADIGCRGGRRGRGHEPVRRSSRGGSVTMPSFSMPAFFTAAMTLITSP